MRSLAFALLVAAAFVQSSPSFSAAASTSTAASSSSASASASGSSSASSSSSVSVAPGHGTTIAKAAQTIIVESGTTKIERPAETIIEGPSTTQLVRPGQTIIKGGGSQSVIGTSVGASGSTIDVHNGVTVINGKTQSPNVAMATAVPAILGGVGVGIAALGGLI